MQIFDIFNKNVNVLNSAVAEVKAQIGTFLINEKLIYDIDPRIMALQKPTGKPDVIKTAGVLAEKSKALLSLQKNLEKNATDFIAAVGTFKAKIDSPLYSFLKTPVASWGLRQYEILGTLVGDINKFTPDAMSLSGRLITQNKNVKTLVSEVASLEKAATGLSGLPKIQGILSSTFSSVLAPITGQLSKVVIPVAIVAVVAGAIWFLPRRRK